MCNSLFLSRGGDREEGRSHMWHLYSSVVKGNSCAQGLIISSCFDQKPFYMISNVATKVGWKVVQKKVFSHSGSKTIIYTSFPSVSITTSRWIIITSQTSSILTIPWWTRVDIISGSGHSFRRGCVMCILWTNIICIHGIMIFFEALLNTLIMTLFTLLLKRTLILLTTYQMVIVFILHQ